MSDTVTVRVADGDVWIDGEHYTHGETLDLAVDVYERIPKSFVKVDDEPEDDTGESEDAEEPEDDTGESEDAEEPEDESDDPDDEPEDESDDPDEFDADAFVDRTPMSDVVEDIDAGLVDDRLDAIESAEKDGRDRSGVLDAVNDRRDDYPR